MGPKTQSVQKHRVSENIALKTNNISPSILSPGVCVKAVEDVTTDVKVERILGGLVQEVRRLDKLRPQRVEQHIRNLKRVDADSRTCT